RGEAAAPFLKAALKDADAEVVRRARRCLADLGPAAGPALPAAAARLLARRAPAGAAAALLDYLPFAEDSVVEDEAFDALLALTPEAGKADDALAAALRAPAAVQRAAAA